MFKWRLNKEVHILQIAWSKYDYVNQSCHPIQKLSYTFGIMWN